MSNYKVKRALPEAAIVHAYRTTPATSRDLAAQYDVALAEIQAILRAHMTHAAIQGLRYAKASRKNSRTMRAKHKTNLVFRPPTV